MRAKTFCRLFGSFESGFSATLFGAGYKVFSDIQFKQYFESESPLSHKIALGAYGSILALSTSSMALTFTDGIVDMCKGTHHYFMASLIKNFSRNEETKRNMSNYLEKTVSLADRELPDVDM